MRPAIQIRQARERLRLATDDAMRLSSLLDLCTLEMRSGNTGEALPLAQQARDLAARMGDRNAQASAMLCVADCQIERGDLLGALDAALNALPVYQDRGDATGTAACLLLAGTCLERLGANEEALQALFRSLAYCSQAGESEMEVRARILIGMLLAEFGSYPEGTEHFRAARVLSEQAGLKARTMQAMLALADMHRHRGERAMKDEPDSARMAFLIAASLVREVKEMPEIEEHPREAAHGHATLGQLHLLLQEPARAMMQFRDLLRLAQSIDDAAMQAAALHDLARSAIELARLSEAESWLAHARELAEKNGLTELAAEITETASALKSREGDDTTALKLYREFHQLWVRQNEEGQRLTTRAQKMWTALPAQRDSASSALTRSISGPEMPSGAEFEDGLTGLQNRRFLELRLQQMIEQCRRDDIPLHLALIDIDRFEEITRGTPEVVGDAILRGVAWIMRDAFRANDLIARYDQYRFAIALAGAASSEASRVLARLAKLISGHDWSELHQNVAIRVVCGSVEVGNEDDYHSALEHAEDAIKASRATGALGARTA
ncbi:MAG: GGDEF domain-containing protein [Betaproteobacteria bacterium]|nr:GGDEF domain-containing protein [Betaproteobacteria bacterium]